MGGVNHIGSTQKIKLKIKLEFIVIFFDLDLSTYILKLDLWVGGATWPIVSGLTQN
jgi:hypothetical protein